MCCRKWGRLPAKGTRGWETVALGVKKVTLRPIRSAAGQLAGAGEACRLEAADGSLVRVRVRVQGGARVGTAAGDAGRWGAQTGRRARPAAPSPGRPAGDSVSRQQRASRPRAPQGVRRELTRPEGQERRARVIRGGWEGSETVAVPRGRANRPEERGRLASRAEAPSAGAGEPAWRVWVPSGSSPALEFGGPQGREEPPSRFGTVAGSPGTTGWPRAPSRFLDGDGAGESRRRASRLGTGAAQGSPAREKRGAAAPCPAGPGGGGCGRLSRPGGGSDVTG